MNAVGLLWVYEDFPLRTHLEQINDASYREDVSLLAVPHIGRLITFLVSGNPAQFLPLLINLRASSSNLAMRRRPSHLQNVDYLRRTVVPFSSSVQESIPHRFVTSPPRADLGRG